MKDIVFAEMYGPQVAEHINKISHQAAMLGRQQGWNEMIQIVQDVLNSGMELNEANIQERITAMLIEEQQPKHQSVVSSNDDSTNPRSSPTPSPTQRKNHLSIVK